MLQRSNPSPARRVELQRLSWGIEMGQGRQSGCLSMDDEPLAYVLSRGDAGWWWRVMDREGETLASGFEVLRSEAQRLIDLALGHVQNSWLQADR